MVNGVLDDALALADEGRVAVEHHAGGADDGRVEHVRLSLGLQYERPTALPNAAVLALETQCNRSK